MQAAAGRRQWAGVRHAAQRSAGRRHSQLARALPLSLARLTVSARCSGLATCGRPCLQHRQQAASTEHPRAAASQQAARMHALQGAPALQASCRMACRAGRLSTHNQPRCAHLGSDHSAPAAPGGARRAGTAHRRQKCGRRAGAAEGNREAGRNTSACVSRTLRQKRYRAACQQQGPAGGRAAAVRRRQRRRRGGDGRGLPLGCRTLRPNRASLSRTTMAAAAALAAGRSGAACCSRPERCAAAAALCELWMRHRCYAQGVGGSQAAQAAAGEAGRDRRRGRGGESERIKHATIAIAACSRLLLPPPAGRRHCGYLRLCCCSTAIGCCDCLQPRCTTYLPPDPEEAGP